MSDLIKRYVKPWTFGVLMLIDFLMGEIFLFTLYPKINDHPSKVSVPGVIYAKDKRSREYNSWIMAVRPFDKKYNNYSVSVDFSIYASYNVGDTICFKVDKDVVTDDCSFFISTIVPLMYILLICVMGVIGVIGVIWSGYFVYMGGTWE